MRLQKERGLAKGNPIILTPFAIWIFLGPHRLHGSSESGNIAIFDERDRASQRVFVGFFAANAHSLAADSRTHRVYWLLQSVGGKPVLRITLPTDKQL